MRIGFVTSQAFSLINFRGTLIRELIKNGNVVFALAPDYDEKMRERIRGLGAIPIDCSLSRTGLNPITDFLDIIKFFFVLKKLNLDVIFSYFVKPVIYGSLAAFFAKIPKRVAMIEGAGFAFSDDDNGNLFKKIILKMTVSFLYKISLGVCHSVYFI